MTPRKKRLLWVVAAIVILAIISVFVVQALRQNMVFFYTPTEVKEGKVGSQEYFRIGGMVTAGSMQRQADGVTMAFTIDDGVTHIPVLYKGILPDLFKEGQGAVAQGHWNGQTFNAREVLAKHDENYMPPEAQMAIDQQHQTARSLKLEQ